MASNISYMEFKNPASNPPLIWFSTGLLFVCPLRGAHEEGSPVTSLLPEQLTSSGGSPLHFGFHLQWESPASPIPQVPALPHSDTCVWETILALTTAKPHVGKHLHPWQRSLSIRSRKKVEQALVQDPTRSQQSLPCSSGWEDSLTHARATSCLGQTFCDPLLCVSDKWLLLQVNAYPQSCPASHSIWI